MLLLTEFFSDSGAVLRSDTVPSSQKREKRKDLYKGVTTIFIFLDQESDTQNDPPKKGKVAQAVFLSLPKTKLKSKEKSLADP